MLGREIGRGAAPVFLAEALAVPAGLLIAATLSRAFGPEGYGRYGVAAAVVAGLEWLIVSAYSRITIQLLSDTEARGRLTPVILRYYLFTSLAVTAALMASAGVLGAALRSPNLAADLRWLAIDIPFFSMAQAQRSILTAQGEYSGRAIAIAARWTVRAAATWGFLALGWGMNGALWAWTAASLAEIAALRRLPWAALWTPVQAGPDEVSIWREGLSPFLFTTGQRLTERIDLILLQTLGAAPPILGLYAAAQNLSILPALLGAAVSPVLIAALTRERLQGREASSRRTAALSLRLFLCLFPLAAVFSICGGDVAAIAFGDAFRAAGTLMPWLVASGIGMTLAAAAASIFSAQGKHRSIGWFSLPYFAAALLCHLIAIPRYGSLGGAIVTAGCFIASGLVGAAIVFRSWGQPFPFPTLARACVATAAVLALSRWDEFQALALPLRLAAPTALCVATLAILGEWNAVRDGTGEGQ